MADNTQEQQVSPIQSGMETVKHLAAPPPKKMKGAADWVRDLRMNADVNKTTVGVETDRVTPDLMLATSSKLLGISRRQIEPDPKDSLEFQRVYGPAEYFSEHILRDAGRLGRQLLWKATNRGNLDFMSTGALDQHVSDVFNSSKLANMIDGSSPLETVDASFKVTRIGEGGVGDISSAPDEMRLVQPSFLGYIDSVRSPECATQRHEVLTINGWKPIADVTTGDSVACMVNGKLEWHKPERVVVYPYEGPIYAYDDGHLAYELTPDHRAWCDTGHGYTFQQASDLHGTEASFQTLGPDGAYDKPGSIQLLPLFYKKFFYQGNVHCLTVPGGMFYTRIRNYSAFWTGNSLKVGLDAYMTKHCMKGSDGKLYQEFINARTGKKELVDSVTAAKSVVTTPDMMKAKTNHIFAVGGKTGVRIVKKSDVDYYLPNMDEAFSAAANLVTNMSGVKEMRLLMGCLHPMTTLVTVGRKNDVDIIYAKDASTSCNDIPGVDAEHHAKDYKIRTTVAKFPRNRAWFRKIVLCSGRVLITSKDHRWPVWRDGRLVLVDAEKLKPDDQVLRTTFKDLPSRRTFVNDTQVTPDVAELLGFISRSGRMVENRLRIAYGKAHREALETAVARLGLKDVKFYVNGADDCLGVSDKWFVDWVAGNMGFGQEARVPSAILGARPNISIYFLDAYTADQTLVAEDALEYTWILDIPSVRQRDGLALLWARMGTDTYYRDAYQGDGRTVLALKLTEFINPVGDCVVDIVKANLPSPSAPIMIDIDIDDNMYATANGVVTHNSKYPLQAVSIEGREPPLVRNLDMRSGSDIHSKIGRYLGARYANKPGIVTAVRQHAIDVQYDDGTKGRVAMYDNFPMNAKGFLTNTPQVKAGDKFKAGDLLASSNYTDDKGTMATGTNLRVGWLSWHGGTYEDAVVLSESAAKKLTSTTMYSTDLDLDKTVALGKKNYQSWKPDEFTAEQLSILDDEGIVKPGTILQKGDPMVLAVSTTEPSPGTMGKRILTDISETWDHDHPGKVTDIVRTRNGVRVLATVTAPAEVGDKVSGLHGNKGVCAKILPDDQMPRDKEGKPLEMLLSPLGLISRTNPAQLNETLLGKVAHKTGKPETLNPFYDGDIRDDILMKLKQNGLNADDDFYDPETGRKIPGVVNGYSYIHKLKHLSESKESARGTDEYACYSADTEVLTDRGWVAWPDVTEGMRLYTYDHATHTAWFEKPSSLYKYEYNGQLVALSGRHCDMLVTPNHNMFIAKYSKNPEARHKFFKAQACDVTKLNRFRMLRAGAPVADEAGYGLAMLTIPGVDYTKNRIRHVYGAESFDCEAFAALLGWILSDGSITQEGKDHSNRVTIYQKADRRAELDSIEQCLRACGKAVTFTDNKEGIRRYVFNDPVLVRWLRKECGCSSVTWRIPEFVFASSATRNAFYGTYMLGDGSSSTGNNVITTVSPQMAEDLTRLLALMGSSSSKTVVTRVRQIREDSAWKYPFNYPIYTVIEHNSPAISFNLKDQRYKLNDIRFVNYSGHVYCATVSTGLLLVRRNGKMCICGNSDETPGGSGYTGAKRYGTLEIGAMVGYCLLGNVRVLTREGYMPISTIVSGRLPVEVLSYNQKTDSFEYKQVTGWFARSVGQEDLWRLTTNARQDNISNGALRGYHHSLRCTKEHRILTPDRGYVQACELKPGDLVYDRGPVVLDWQMAIIKGTVMGDGYMSKHTNKLGETCSNLRVVHGPKQHTYTRWIYEKLHNLCQSEPSVVTRTMMSPAGYPGSGDQMRMATVSAYELSVLADRFYIELDGRRHKTVPKGIVREMGYAGIAVWYMDDGSVERSRGHKAHAMIFHTCGFTVEEVNQLCEEMNAFTGLHFNVLLKGGKYPLLQLKHGPRGTANPETAIFSERLAPYITEDFRYKLGDNYPTDKPVGTFWQDKKAPDRMLMHGEPCIVTESCPLQEVPPEGYVVYDITVPDNHNFIASGIVVSNSAFDNLLDNKLIRGQQNSEFWRSIRTGGIPTIPGEPLVQKKFFAHLQGSGVNVRKTPKGISVFALSNSDVKELAGPREVKTRDTYEARTFRPIDGGLFGQDVFGQNGDRWGYIQLDEPVPNPVMEEPLARLLRMTDKDFNKVVTGTGEVNGLRGTVQLRDALSKIDLEQEAKQAMQEFKDAPASKKDAALKRYTAVEEMRRAGLNPAEYMLDRIPVLPAQFRPVSSHNGLTMVADANYLYAQLLDARDDMRDSKDLPQEYQDKARANLYRTWQELVGLYDPEDIKLRNKNVGGLLKWALGTSPKFSSFHRKVLGGAVDTVGRGVIVPNARLTIDQVGIPISMAFGIMAPFVERGLVKRGYTPVDAMKMVKNQDKRALDVLQEVVKTHPVEINRAPTLHRFNIQAQEPVLVQGHSIQVHPSICPALAGDFDGDQINIHVPVSDNARKEAMDKMRPSRNLIAPSDRKILFKPEKEYMQGLYIATRLGKETGRPVIFRTVQEAKEAYRSGAIDIDTPIRIMEQK